MTIFVPDLPEFAPLVAGLSRLESCRVQGPRGGYWRIDGSGEIVLARKELGLSPALWNSALSGGFIGRVAEFSRDVLRIVDDTARETSETPR
jgi:hypothetical protein